MKLNSLILLTLCGGITLTSAATAPDTYYSSLEGYRGTTLRKAAKNIVRDHTAISYGNQTWEAFYITDTRVVDGKLCWWDMYSPNDVLASSPGSHSGMNIEHTIPNSWWGGTKNDAYKDLFELNPSDSKANSAKSNYPYGEIEGSYNFDNGVTFVGHPKSGQTGSSQGNWCYEPLDEYKGDFARSLFYMYTVYDDIAWSSSTAWMYTVGSDMLLQDWAIEMLLRWSKQDPVSEKEIARNEAVYGIQHNRNPYIDLPGLEDFVWGSRRNVDFSLDYIENPDIPVIPDDPDNPDNPDNPDDPVVPDDPIDPKPVPEGVWYAVTTAADLNNEDYYVIVSAQNNVFMTDECAGKYMKSGNLAQIKTDSGAEFLSSVPEGTALLRLEHISGNQYYIAVHDTHYNVSHGFLNSTATKNVNLADDKIDTAKADINISSSGEATISFGNLGKLLYNSSSPRFTTYTSDQEHLRLFRMHEDISTGAATVCDDHTVTVYTIQGINVGRGDEKEMLNSLPAGLYIIVKQDKTYKINKR